MNVRAVFVRTLYVQGYVALVNSERNSGLKIVDTLHNTHLSPVHTFNNVEETLSNATSRTMLSTK